jgi:heavy metal sensor kinase
MRRTGLFGTIRARLVALSVGALAVSLALFAVFAYAAFSYSLWQQHDAGLEATVDTIAIAFETGIRVERGDESEAAHHMLNELRFPSRRIGVYTLDGKPFPRESTKPGDPHHAHGPGVDIADVELAELARTQRLDANTERVVFLTRETDDGPVRTAVEGFRSTAGNSYLIVAEEPNAAVAATLALLRNALLVAVPFFLLLAFAAGWFLAERSLAPIAAMSERARTITATNLDARLPVANDRDELGELALVFNELLDRLERAFSELERAYSQMRQFIADASHELRTPLAAVRGEVQVALKRPREGEEYRESLGVIHEEAIHMSRIVEDLFTLARADAGERPLDRLPFYLDELVAECCRTLRPLAAEHGVDLAVEPGAGEVEIEGDEGLIRRAVLNLIDNAVKYTEAEGCVRVIVSRDGDLVHVDVADTGIGIAPADQERIFDRFYRVDRARVRSEGGAGLGLSIVRWAVEAHGGEVAVRSEPGRGTTFSLLLPVAQAPIPPQSPGPSVDGAAV